MAVPGSLQAEDTTLALFDGQPVRTGDLSPWPHFGGARATLPALGRRRAA